MSETMQVIIPAIDALAFVLLMVGLTSPSVVAAIRLRGYEPRDKLLNLYLADELTAEEYEVRVGARMGLAEDQMELRGKR